MIHSRKIRILFCIDSLARGGSELQLIGLINRLDRERFLPHLLTIRPAAEPILPDDCPHRYLHVPKIFSPHGLKSAWKVSRWVREENIDIIHSFFPDATMFGTFAGLLASTPVRIASFRDLGFWRSRVQDMVLRRIYRSQTAFLCNAMVVADHYASAFGLPRERFEIIYNGIDKEALPWVEHAGSIRDVGIVGNMTRRVKRTDLFLRAAALVSQKHPHVRWHVVGDGHLRPEMEKLAEDLGISGQTVFTGRISQVDQYLEKLPVAVLCSDSEGFSNAVLEYMFKGSTPVLTDVGGNAEIVEDGVNGLLVPPDDPAALAAALERLINDPEFCHALSRRARETVETEFSWEKCVETHAAFYQKTLAFSR